MNKQKNTIIISFLVQVFVTIPIYLILEVIKNSLFDGFGTLYLTMITITGLILGLVSALKTKRWWLPIVVSLSSGFFIVILGMILTILFSYRPEHRAAIFFAFLVAMIQVIYIFAVIIASLLILAINEWQNLARNRANEAKD